VLINIKRILIQGKAKKTRKFAAVKRMLNPNDIRLYAPNPLLPIALLIPGPIGRKENQLKQKKKEEEEKEKAVRRVYVQLVITSPLAQSFLFAELQLLRRYSSHTTRPLFRHTGFL